MPLEIFDYRTDIRNLLVTPHIRSRFLRMEPGQVANRHSHDLGHEIFLILQGRAHFEVDGEEAELGPGQLCVARVDEPHQVRVVGDEPMVMYLSVTPHVQPTHTSRTERGERLPTRFAPSSAYDVETDTETPVAELVDRFVEASAQLAESAAEAAASQKQLGEHMKLALSQGDGDTASEHREAMWQGLYGTFQDLHALADQWNTLAPRAGTLEARK